jgi:hypothetical protein
LSLRDHLADGSRSIADTCSSLKRRHWAALVVALVGVHALDIIITLRAWKLESHPVATAIGPTAWVVAHILAVAMALAAAWWARRRLGDHWAVALLGIGIVTGATGPTGNLLALGQGPTGQLTVGAMLCVGVATLAVATLPRPSRQTVGRMGRVAVGGLLVTSVWAGISVQPGSTGTAVAQSGNGGDGVVFDDFEDGIDIFPADAGSIGTVDPIEGSQYLVNDKGRAGSVTPASYDQVSFYFRPGPNADGRLDVNDRSGNELARSGQWTNLEYEFYDGGSFNTATLSENHWYNNTLVFDWDDGNYDLILTNMSTGETLISTNSKLLRVDERTDIHSIYLRNFDGQTDFDFISANGATLGPDTTTVSGTVQDTSGGPIGDATVRAYNLDTQQPAANNTTDTQGNYSLELEPGNYSVTAVADNYSVVTNDVTVSNATTLDFTLPSLDDATDADPDDTDGDGLDDDVDPDDDDDGIPDDADPDDDNDGVPDVAEVVLSGVVYNRSSVAINNATVTVTNATSDEAVASATTNLSGEYTTRIGQSTHAVTAQAPGYPGRNGTIDTTGVQEATLNFQLRRSEAPVVSNLSPRETADGEAPYYPTRANRTLSANVTDPEGSPVNVTIYWLNRTGRTGAFEAIATTTTTGGTVTAEAPSQPGRNFWYLRATDDAGATTTSATGAWATPGELRVTNVSGGVAFLIDDETVSAEIKSLESAYTDTRATTNGTVPLTGVPNETITVGLSAPGYQNATYRLPTPAVSAGVQLAETSDDASDGTVGNDPPVPGYGSDDLYGHVRTSTGRPVGNTTVIVSNQSIYRATTTNASGAWALGNLSDGDYEVEAVPRNDSLRATENTVSLPGQTNLTIVVERGSAPTFVEGSATPQGTVSSRQVQLQIGVTDPEFATAAGDTVNVSFYLDGQRVGSDELTGPGTAATTTTLPAASSATWWAVATDNYSRETRSSNYTVATPSEIILRNETSPNETLTSVSNATVTFYGPDGSVERPVTDEEINLTGVPIGNASDPTVAEFEATGYYTRSLVLDNLADQQTAFLLSTAIDSSTVVFSLDDRTGRFPPRETTLYVDRPLTVNNTSAYRVIESDRFGATGEVAVELDTGARYRLRIKNENGETRALEHYTARGDDAATLPVAQVAIAGGGQGAPAATAAISEHDGQAAVKIAFLDTAERTDTVSYRVVNTTADALVAQGDLTNGPFGRASVTVPVPSATGSYRVEITGEREGALPDAEFEEFVGQPAGVAKRLDGLVDPQVLQMGGLVLLTVFGGLFGLVGGWAGALAIALVGTGLSVLGILPIPAPALGLAGAIGAVRMASRGGEEA